ncbi:MAG TPA: LacI family transcriptional regulator [Sphingobium sp.]|jgi:LacI family transcriptional regulator|uniref:LacI family DNA-binding transcriptional regulator n=1 Tax=Sphingobium sp. TaxID=1912891 RepID=UPI000ED2F426|nr:LacI family DNA-binding transcriptional regulator [Sphingobium sp.]HAF43201.1 LacI family transcriptional regulator [Sphingobium sp.]
MKSPKNPKRKPPTIREVAARAGVSVMTASRAINGKALVSAKAQRAVEQAVAELGYVPNATARALAGSADRRVALLHSNSTTSAYLGELLLGALGEAPQRHLHLVVEQCAPGAFAAEIVDQVAKAHVAGVILPPPLCDWADLVELLQARDIAVVGIAPDREGAGMLSVGTDDRHAAYDLTRHLVDLGHRRIGFIQGNPRHRASARRLQGFRDCLADCGIAVDERWIVPGDFSYRSGLDAAEQLLTLDTPPSAIFACNDDMAAAAITVAHQRRINVPADVTICGFDDTPLAGAIWPALTTIRQPIRDMAREAIGLLGAHFRSQDEGSDDDALGRVKLDYQLIRRQSDAVPARH